MLDFLHDFELGLSVETLGGESAFKLLDSLGKLIRVVVDRVDLLAQLVALAAEVLDLGLNFLDCTVDSDAFIGEGLKLVELLTQLLLDRVAGLLSVDHVAALLDHICVDLPNLRLEDLNFFVDLGDLHVVGDVVGFSEDLLGLVRDDGFLGDVNLGEPLSSAPLAKHVLSILAVELSLGSYEGFVLLGERIKVLLLLLGLFLLLLFLQLLTLFWG